MIGYERWRWKWRLSGHKSEKHIHLLTKYRARRINGSGIKARANCFLGKPGNQILSEGTCLKTGAISAQKGQRQSENRWKHTKISLRTQVMAAGLAHFSLRSVGNSKNGRNNLYRRWEKPLTSGMCRKSIISSDKGFVENSAIEKRL